MRRLISLFFLFALALSSTGAVAQTADATQGSLSQITLYPGDVVRVQVYREQELNGDFLVDENGVVVLPLIGERKVTDIPVGRLRTELTEAYRVHLRNPSIAITPLRRINVMGEVQKPGMYPLDPTVSLAGAVATAGGATPTGNLSRIRIVRGDQVIHQRIGAAETLNDADIRSGDQIIVDRRSWFDRNSTFMVSALLSVTSIITTIILNS